MLSLYISILQKVRMMNFENKYFIHIMVRKKLVPLAGLPNQGSGKKLQKRHWLSTRKNFLTCVIPVSCQEQLRESGCRCELKFVLFISLFIFS